MKMATHCVRRKLIWKLENYQSFSNNFIWKLKIITQHFLWWKIWLNISQFSEFFLILLNLIWVSFNIFWFLLIFLSFLNFYNFNEGFLSLAQHFWNCSTFFDQQLCMLLNIFELNSIYFYNYFTSGQISRLGFTFPDI